MLELNRKLNKTRNISGCEGDKHQQKYAWNILFLKYANVHAVEHYCDDLHKIQIMAWGKALIKRALMEWLDLISDHHMRAITSQKVIVLCFWLAINIRQNLWWNNLSHFPLIISPFYEHVGHKIQDDSNFGCKWWAVSKCSGDVTDLHFTAATVFLDRALSENIWWHPQLCFLFSI